VFNLFLEFRLAFFSRILDTGKQDHFYIKNKKAHYLHQVVGLKKNFKISESHQLLITTTSAVQHTATATHITATHYRVVVL